jgi:quercetin dioxygenase-like cupin family protein
MKRRRCIVLLLACGCSFAPAPWATGRPHVTKSEKPSISRPEELQWRDGPASLPPGARMAVLEGDPAKEGPFTMRLKAPDGYRIPPHTHPKTERLTVISGTFLLGMGERFDPDGLAAMPAGSYGFWPAGMAHYVQVRGETVVQLHGNGPWQIVYVNPADDPRRSGK